MNCETANVSDDLGSGFTVHILSYLAVSYFENYFLVTDVVRLLNI